MTSHHQVEAPRDVDASVSPSLHRPSPAEKRTGHIMGAWFLGTFVFSIPAFWFYDPLLDHAQYIVGGDHDTVLRWPRERDPARLPDVAQQAVAPEDGHAGPRGRPLGRHRRGGRTAGRLGHARRTSRAVHGTRGDLGAVSQSAAADRELPAVADPHRRASPGFRVATRSAQWTAGDRRCYSPHPRPRGPHPDARHRPSRRPPRRRWLRRERSGTTRWLRRERSDRLETTFRGQRPTAQCSGLTAGVMSDTMGPWQ